MKLWVGLGNALADHAGTMTPAAELAFARAAELAPGYPAPPFFLGLAKLARATAKGRCRALAARSWPAPPPTPAGGLWSRTALR